MSKYVILATILSTSLCQIEPDINYYRSFEKLFDLTSVCNNISNEVSEGCKEQFMEICKNKTLLFSIYDANLKVPYSGLNTFTRVDLSNYDKCMSIDHQYDKGRILGKYCFSELLIEDIDPKNFLNFSKLSVCKPHNCSANDYRLMFKEFNNHALFIDGICETKEYSSTVTSFDIIITCAFGIILVLMCLSTIYDMKLRRNDQKPHHPILLAFSVQSNWKKLTKVTDQNNKEHILVLNGLKVFSMMWVLYGHSASSWVLFFIFVSNTADLLEKTHELYEFYLAGAPYAVDTFFYISGFLLAWSYMKIKSVSLKTQILNIPIMYFYRYIRLTPALVAIILVDMSVFKYMGSGPFWENIADGYAEPCREYWWSSILYIQNYYNYDNVCLLHTWYLSADMQMFVLAPLVVIPLAVVLRNPKRLIHCMIAMILLNCIVTGVPIWMRMANRDTKNSDFPTHNRLVDYCFGIMLGTFMRETKDQPFLGTKLSLKTKWYLNLAIWCIFLTGFIGLLIGTMQIELYSEYEGLWTFFMVKRFIWSILLSWLIYSSYHGYGGVISYILSNPLMQVGSKLTYSMYLVHFLVIIQSVASLRTTVYITDYFLFRNFASLLVVTTIIGIFWTLAFEFPFMVIQSCLLLPVRAKKT